MQPPILPQVLVPADHVSRSANDTYYVGKDTVLRCHTSAHQVQAQSRRAWFVVYLRTCALSWGCSLVKLCSPTPHAPASLSVQAKAATAS